MLCSHKMYPAEHTTFHASKIERKYNYNVGILFLSIHLAKQVRVIGVVG